MVNPELIIILLNTVIVLVAYLIIYPKAAGSDVNKIAINDVIASVISIVVAGSMFWGSNQEFNVLFTSVNWFWFTILSYAAIEIPFMIWYCKKHNV